MPMARPVQGQRFECVHPPGVDYRPFMILRSTFLARECTHGHGPNSHRRIFLCQYFHATGNSCNPNDRCPNLFASLGDVVVASAMSPDGAWLRAAHNGRWLPLAAGYSYGGRKERQTTMMRPVPAQAMPVRPLARVDVAEAGGGLPVASEVERRGLPYVPVASEVESLAQV